MKWMNDFQVKSSAHHPNQDWKGAIPSDGEWGGGEGVICDKMTLAYYPCIVLQWSNIFYADFIAAPKPNINYRKNTRFGFQWMENSW